MPPSATSFYDHLGVARGVSEQDIRLAYRRGAQKYHPDRAQSRPEAAERMAQLNKAYEVLSDPAQRAAYDQSLDAATPGAAAPRFIPLAIGGWPWYVLCGTLSVILLALGFLAVRTLAPARAIPVAASPVQAPASADPLAHVTPAPVWVAPTPGTTPAANDPVVRLVRDGVAGPAAPPR